MKQSRKLKRLKWAVVGFPGVTAAVWEVGGTIREKMLLLVHDLTDESTPNQQVFIECLQNANQQTFPECLKMSHYGKYMA